MKIAARFTPNLFNCVPEGETNILLLESILQRQSNNKWNVKRT